MCQKISSLPYTNGTVWMQLWPWCLQHISWKNLREFQGLLKIMEHRIPCSGAILHCLSRSVWTNVSYFVGPFVVLSEWTWVDGSRLRIRISAAYRLWCQPSPLSKTCICKGEQTCTKNPTTWSLGLSYKTPFVKCTLKNYESKSYLVFISSPMYSHTELMRPGSQLAGSWAGRMKRTITNNNIESCCCCCWQDLDISENMQVTKLEPWTFKVWKRKPNSRDHEQYLKCCWILICWFLLFHFW